MMNRIARINFFFFTLLALGCTQVQEYQPIRLAISKAVPEKSYHYYVDWVHSIDSTIECIDMYHLGKDSALLMLKQCDGLLITGGEDIDPVYYHEKIDTLRCDAPNTYRDSIDFALIRLATADRIPVMGICRGLQALNVFYGGSLYFDIPSDLDTLVKHRNPHYKGADHFVHIENGSELFKIAGLNEGITYSNHHQGIKVLGKKLKAVAHTDDGLPEAIELTNPIDDQFFLGVQWHPEHMDYQSPLSGNISRAFVAAMKEYQKANQHYFYPDTSITHLY